MPDLNKAISNRRKNLNKTYRSAEWKKNVKEFIAGKKCEWCGTTEKLLAHHPYLESYKDGTYGDLYLSGCMVLCNRCHFSLHKGLVLCKTCCNHYHGVSADCCRTCYLDLHPEIVEAKQKKKDDVKALKKSLRDAEKAKAKQWKKEHPVIKYKPGHQTKVAEEAGTLKVPLRQKVGEDSARRKAYKDSGWF